MLSPNDFVFWLDGFLAQKEVLDSSDIEIVKSKLAQVFLKITPIYGNSTGTPQFQIDKDTSAVFQSQLISC